MDVVFGEVIIRRSFENLVSHKHVQIPSPQEKCYGLQAVAERGLYIMQVSPPSLGSSRVTTICRPRACEFKASVFNIGQRPGDIGHSAGAERQQSRSGYKHWDEREIFCIK